MEIVCKQWTEKFEIYGYHIEDILSLIQEAYGERAKEGISFDTLNYTIEDFLAERTDTDYWFLAFDEDHRLYGTARLTVIDNYGEICNFAVLPQSQGKHVGSQLLHAANDFAIKQKLNHIKSFTATKAVSSVKCHCQNSFRIVGVGKNGNKGYASYYMRNQLSFSLFWKCVPLIKARLLLSYIKYLLDK